jgi:hypothetical protein
MDLYAAALLVFATLIAYHFYFYILRTIQPVPQYNCGSATFIASYYDKLRFFAKDKDYILTMTTIEPTQSRLHAKYLLLVHRFLAVEEVISRKPAINTSIIQNCAALVDFIDSTASAIVQDEPTNFSPYLQKIPVDIDGTTANIIVPVTLEVKEEGRVWKLSVSSNWIPSRHSILHDPREDVRDLFRRMNDVTMSPGIRSESTATSWTTLPTNGSNDVPKQATCPGIPIEIEIEEEEKLWEE